MKGPLGQGIANAVGLALALKHLAARFNKPDSESVDHYTYCIVGDGCNMEGILNEACSLAGHWDLGKLIVFYDDNHISIDGDTKIAFTEDVSDSLGWHALWVKNGNDGYDEIRKAIQEAKSVTDKPTLLKVTTTIGFGSPNKANSYAVHGAALGSSEVEAYRAATCSNRRRGPLPATVGVEGCYRPQPASRASTGGSRYRGLLLAAAGIATGSS